MSRAPNRHTQHCGLVAMVGAPNVGKSTLTNRLVGAKVAIVTPKAQTTRSRVIGVRSEGVTQVVLVDTPGIFRPKRRLDRAMVHTAWREAGDADEVCLLIDSNKGVDPPTRAIADRLHEAGRQVTAVFNKIDLVPRSKLLHLVESLVQIVKCREVFMISAQSGDGVDDLFADLVKQMPLGPWLFPEDQLSDMSDRLMAAEITREKLMISLRNELPYDLAVETDDWQEFQNGALRISQVVYVARESQKGIVLGNNGAQIRRIREAAQRDLHAIYGTRIHLFIQVKVRPHWDDDPQHFQDLGLDYNA